MSETDRDLPEGWKWMSLSDAAGKAQYGWTTKARRDGSVKLLRTTDITSGSVDWSLVPGCETPPSDISKYELHSGDIVVSRAGSVGFNYLLDDACPAGAVFASYLMRLRPRDDVISSRYLKHYMNSGQYWADVADQAVGIGMANLNGSKLGAMQVPVPPRRAQDAICAYLDYVSARTSLTRRHLASAKMIIDRFRQSVLAAACSGELTAQWRLSCGRSSAPDLNQRPSISHDSDDLDVPTEWQTFLMDELCTKITSGSRDWTQYYGRGAGTFVMAQNVRRGSIDWSYRQDVDPPLTDSARDRSQIRMGDLLVTIVGANTGDVGPVNEDRPQHYVCQSVALMRPRNTAATPFLNLWFSSLRHGRKYLMECAYGAGRPHLSFAHLRNAPMALPSQEEQDEIIR